MMASPGTSKAVPAVSDFFLCDLLCAEHIALTSFFLQLEAVVVLVVTCQAADAMVLRPIADRTFGTRVALILFGLSLSVNVSYS